MEISASNNLKTFEVKYFRFEQGKNKCLKTLNIESTEAKIYRDACLKQPSGTDEIDFRQLNETEIDLNKLNLEVLTEIRSSINQFQPYL